MTTMSTCLHVRIFTIFLLVVLEFGKVLRTSILPRSTFTEQLINMHVYYLVTLAVSIFSFRFPFH